MSNTKTTGGAEFEVVSFFDDIGVVTETMKVVKRRALRIDVKHFSPPVMIGGFGSTTRAFRVQNIAEFGAAFLTEGEDLTRHVGQEMHCQLAIGSVQIPLISRILYLSRELAGVEFINPTSSSRLALRTHFFFEFAVISLGPAPKIITKNAGRSRTLAYGSADGQGMEIILDDGKIQSFKIGLAHIGAEVRWDQQKVLRVLVSSDVGVPPPYVRNQLFCFLRNVRGLNPFIRQSMETHLSESAIEIEKV